MIKNEDRTNKLTKGMSELMENSMMVIILLLFLNSCSWNSEKCTHVTGKFINSGDSTIILEINQRDYQLKKGNKCIGGGFFDIQGNNIRFFNFNLSCTNITKKHIAMGNIFGCNLIFNEDDPTCNFVKL